MKAVASSMMSHIGYFDQVIFIRMLTGQWYAYEGPDRETYDDFSKSLSVGTYYNRKIKGRFPCTILN